MRIVSYNVNGIRSALKKGFLEWLASDPADVICVQEIKAMQADIDVDAFEQLGYHSYWFSAEKKGYSGVAILSKLPADVVFYGNKYEQSDFEGRLLRMDIGPLSIINCYFPSGTTGEIRQAYKYQWLDELFEYLTILKNEKRNIILCGDYNICHTEIDIHDPIRNKNSSGFLPEERQWMDKFFELGFCDTFRKLNLQPDAYSWWSYRAGARGNNKGWRIDYISCSESLLSYLKSSAIWPEVKHSDHCPVYAEFDFSALPII